jgi:hypothetical protein
MELWNSLKHNSERNVGYRIFKNELGHCVLNIGTYACLPQITGQMMQSAQKIWLAMRSAVSAAHATGAFFNDK